MQRQGTALHRTCCMDCDSMAAAVRLHWPADALASQPATGYTCTLIALILSIAALATSVVNDRSYVLTYDDPQSGAGVAYWVDTYKVHANSMQISMWGYRISVDAYPDAEVKDNYGGGTDVAATTDITPRTCCTATACPTRASNPTLRVRVALGTGCTVRHDGFLSVCG